jgi:hypothetical protein
MACPVTAPVQNPCFQIRRQRGPVLLFQKPVEPQVAEEKKIQKQDRGAQARGEGPARCKKGRCRFRAQYDERQRENQAEKRRGQNIEGGKKNGKFRRGPPASIFSG